MVERTLLPANVNQATIISQFIGPACRPVLSACMVSCCLLLLALLFCRLRVCYVIPAWSLYTIFLVRREGRGGCGLLSGKWGAGGVG